jgi:hypothetical protein
VRAGGRRRGLRLHRQFDGGHMFFLMRERGACLDQIEAFLHAHRSGR